MSSLICIEGIDGSGKTTQIQLLADALRLSGVSVRVRSYPVYDSFFGTVIGRLLAGKDAANASTLPPKSMALWYALDRWHDFQRNREQFEGNGCLLLNRYTLSSIVYQSLRAESLEDSEEIEAWVDTLEHSILGLPRPDLYIILDLAPEIAQSLVSRKDVREYMSSRGEKDVYESNLPLLKRARNTYLRLAANLSNAEIVQCQHDGLPLGTAEISRAVQEALAQRGIL